MHTRLLIRDVLDFQYNVIFEILCLVIVVSEIFTIFYNDMIIFRVFLKLSFV